ncbi:MAG TPA: uroporphyrinogen-III synthase, partial [Candidatus Limnocylindrales bacterium]|nr:uroporphyrinogen-III synthase [Candidatus Limnocylindrales bacterium]
LPVPAIEITALGPTADLDDAVRAAMTADRTVVTSPAGARSLARHVARLGIEARPRHWAAIGRGTVAALAPLRPADVWRPSEPEARVLAAELPIEVSERLVVVRGSLAGDRLERALRARGADVTTAVLYETREAPAASRSPLASALDRSPAAVVVASPSGVRGLLALAGDRAPDLLALPVVCIGPTTADAAARAGFATLVQARSPDAASVADAVASAVPSPARPILAEVRP